MRRRALVPVAVALVLGAAASVQAVEGPGLHARAHGVVDLGDGVDVVVSGPGCAAARTRVQVTVPDRVVHGPEARGCSGTAQVPTFDQVRAAGWRQGDPIEIAVVSGEDRVPLRYQRIDVDSRPVVAGSPSRQAGTDPDTGPHDAVLALSTGDVVDLGRADVTGIDSVGLRMCITRTPSVPVTLLSDMDLPVRLSVHQDSPDGPALVHEVDASSNLTTFFRLQSAGFGPSCWRLGSLPVTGRPVEAAPRLFLKVDAALPGTFWLNAVDLNGTGARSTALPRWVTPDPAGMRTVFDGTSFDGWTQSGCALRDGAVTGARTGDRTAVGGCTLTHATSASNRVVRLEVRREDFYDNGGIMVPAEIQLRSAGEFLPGGYFMGYAARWQKLNAWPAWSQLEIVQLGARYVVRVNGRTVTDHVAASGAPGPYRLQLLTQPVFSHRLGASSGFGSETQPDLTTPDEWGGFWFRNVRTYECSSPEDPVCTSLAAVSDGQAPKG